MTIPEVSLNCMKRRYFGEGGHHRVITWIITWKYEATRNMLKLGIPPHGIPASVPLAVYVRPTPSSSPFLCLPVCLSVSSSPSLSRCVSLFLCNFLCSFRLPSLCCSKAPEVLQLLSGFRDLALNCKRGVGLGFCNFA